MLRSSELNYINKCENENIKSFDIMALLYNIIEYSFKKILKHFIAKFIKNIK